MYSPELFCAPAEGTCYCAHAAVNVLTVHNLLPADVCGARLFSFAMLRVRVWFPPPAVDGMFALIRIRQFSSVQFSSVHTWAPQVLPG